MYIYKDADAPIKEMLKIGLVFSLIHPCYQQLHSIFSSYSKPRTCAWNKYKQCMCIDTCNSIFSKQLTLKCTSLTICGSQTTSLKPNINQNNSKKY